MSGRVDSGGREQARPSRPAGAPDPTPGPWRRLLRRPRLFAEVRFALGAALVWAAAGTLLAFAMPPLRLAAGDSPAERLFVQGAVGFGLGWWGGLFWSVALAANARRFRPAPEPDALMTAVWLGAAIAAVGAVALRAGGASAVLAVGGGIVAATVGARVAVGRAAREAGR
jgi:hypothetical protein